MVGKAQVFRISPRAAARPAFQARPILQVGKCFGNGDGRRRIYGGGRGQFVHPLKDFGREPVGIHPVHKKRDIGLVARGHRLHLIEQGIKFLLIELSIEIEAEQVIGEAYLFAHLQILGESFGPGEIAALNGVGEQRAQCARAKLGDFGQTIQSRTSVRTLFGVRRPDLEHSEVELIKIVVRFLFDRGGKLQFLFGDVTLGARKPAGHDVIGGFFAVAWGNIGKGMTRGIELSKTQRGRGKIQLTLEIVVAQTGDLCAPGNGGIAVLFFGRFRQSIKGGQGIGLILFLGRLGQNVKGGQRVRIELQGLLRNATGLVKFLFTQKRAGLPEQTSFPPLVVDSVSGAKENQTEGDKDDDTARDEGEMKGARELRETAPGPFLPFSPDTFDLGGHSCLLCPATKEIATRDRVNGRPRFRRRVPTRAPEEDPRFDRPRPRAGAVPRHNARAEL